MSLLSMVEGAIVASKAEQARINDNIQLYREILHTLKLQPKAEDLDCENFIATEAETSPGEKEDMELLERALEKALRIRTGKELSKKDPGKNLLSVRRKEPSKTAVTSTQGGQTTSRSTSKSASLDRKGHKKPGTRNIVVKNCPVSSAKTSQQGASASGCPDQGQLHVSTLHSKSKTIRGDTLSGNDLGKVSANSTPSSNNSVPVSHREESGAHTVPPQNGITSDQTAKWKSLRRKQDRLWDKVATIQRKPVPGRSHFMERMRATFPMDWPRGCPDQTRALVDRLTHRGLDLSQQCQTEELLAKQTPGATTELDGNKNTYNSLTLERLQMTAAELHNFAEQVKHEWEAWDRWRPEGGCLCPCGANGVWEDGKIAPLPLTITYTTEAELKEFERLRMRVALLQQDIDIEQALSDTLTLQLPSIIPGATCLNGSMLRDMYSLLGEGGERFPTIVLDSEPD